MTVCCVEVGNYAGRGNDYVNILHNAVEKHLTVPHQFICFTDNPHGKNCECRPINGRGWFAKLYLFKQFKEGKVIFLDLDTLIVDNIDFLDNYNGKFAILRDFYRPKGYGSGIMMWRGGFGHEITNSYILDGCPDVIGGDQTYIEQMVKTAKRVQDLFPNKVVSYKEHAMAGIPRKAAIICFHGYPKPSDFEFGYVKDLWKS